MVTQRASRPRRKMRNPFPNFDQFIASRGAIVVRTLVKADVMVGGAMGTARTR